MSIYVVIDVISSIPLKLIEIAIYADPHFYINTACIVSSDV